MSYAVEVANAMLGELDPTDSKSRVDYMVDFLGSVTGSTDNNGGQGSDRRYKPFGEVLSGDPVKPFDFAWTGNTGSMYTGLLYSEQYNRARHYSTTTNIWTTRDPIWPSEHPYVYVNGNPVMRTDPTGEKLRIVNCEDGIEKRLRRMCKILEGLSSGDRKKIDSCISRSSKVSYQTCQPFNNARLECYKKFCRDGYIDCRKGDGNNLGYCPSFKEPTDNPDKPTGGIILYTPLDASNWTTIYGGIQDGREGRITMLHEIAHACGVEHGAYGDVSPCQCNDIYACCIFEVGMGRSGEKCVDAMKKYIGAKKPC